MGQPNGATNGATNGPSWGTLQAPTPLYLWEWQATRQLTRCQMHQASNSLLKHRRSHNQDSMLLALEHHPEFQRCLSGMSTTSMSSLPQPNSMPNAAPQGFASNQPNMKHLLRWLHQPYGGAAPYRPGSTGRSTAYNFGAPQTSAAAGQSLPTSNVPHTANGLPAPQPNLYR
jgi:hypothetical protein